MHRYLGNAFPADELMPLSCKGRWTRSRGDMDFILGNYSLTLIDALDSLVIFGLHEEFATAIKNISDTVSFDKDLVVSPFEVNIGLLPGGQGTQRLPRLVGCQAALELMTSGSHVSEIC